MVMPILISIQIASKTSILGLLSYVFDVRFRNHLVRTFVVRWCYRPLLRLFQLPRIIFGRYIRGRRRLVRGILLPMCFRFCLSIQYMLWNTQLRRHVITLATKLMSLFLFPSNCVSLLKKCMSPSIVLFCLLYTSDAADE